MTTIDSRLSFASFISLLDLQALEEIGISVEYAHIWAEDPLGIHVPHEGTLVCLHYVNTRVRPPQVEILVLSNRAAIFQLVIARKMLMMAQEYFERLLIECTLEA